jgi:hypothetical protein
MRIIGTVTQEVEIITDIICNKCGGSCKASVVPGGFNGLIEAEVHGGYDSTHMSDGDIYVFSLCEKCLIDVVKDFKHPAKQYNINDPISFDEEKD